MQPVINNSIVAVDLLSLSVNCDRSAAETASAE